MEYRPPAIPLVTHDPYLSIWSFTDRLADDWTRHWTGATNGLAGLLRIDGKCYRILGLEPHGAPALEQVSLTVLPTRTIYTFETAGIRLTLSFITPLLPEDLDLISRPITYIVWEAATIDGAEHQVEVYLDVNGELATNTQDQTVSWGQHRLGPLRALRMGHQSQPVLEKAGDNLRIDWGFVYLAAEDSVALQSVIASSGINRASFAKSGTLPDTDDLRMPRSAHDEWPAMAFRYDLGKVSKAPVSCRMMLAYDDIFALEYFHRKVRPYWRRSGLEMDSLLKTAHAEFEDLDLRSRKFDDELMSDLRAAGGEEYAWLGALSYRQCLAAHKLAIDIDGTPLYMSKENFSNGCIDTVDVTYPSAPFFLLLQPELLRAQITPILDYARSKRWKFPFAPHDLGTYPKANGQVYGGAERSEQDQMPVEECGNMLLLTAALSAAEENVDFAAGYWPILEQWASYLRERGMDPENQLCTDDFAGHMAHNTNLSLKAILALGAFAQLAVKTGHETQGREYMDIARQMANAWIAAADDGDHYRLAFDQVGSWSLKYNLVWDRLLGLNLFPDQVRQREIACYKERLTPFGVPLDNRNTYTKLDWEVWAATLADNPEDMKTLIAPLITWATQTPTRVPLTDWYDTKDGRQIGFQARSVVGGNFIPLLYNKAVWKKWRCRARAR